MPSLTERCHALTLTRSGGLGSDTQCAAARTATTTLETCREHISEPISKIQNTTQGTSPTFSCEMSAGNSQEMMRVRMLCWRQLAASFFLMSCGMTRHAVGWPTCKHRTAALLAISPGNHCVVT